MCFIHIQINTLDNILNIVMNDFSVDNFVKIVTVYVSTNVCVYRYSLMTYTVGTYFSGNDFFA